MFPTWKLVCGFCRTGVWPGLEAGTTVGFTTGAGFLVWADADAGLAAAGAGPGLAGTVWGLAAAGLAGDVGVWSFLSEDWAKINPNAEKTRNVETITRFINTDYNTN
ncbi:hypothetical protein AGMMS49546_08900 [Spirochaetia bacterium]|nr:hypothetical protein AGMMS49546_08900 [Spirochaetia bacterium]